MFGIWFSDNTYENLPPIFFYTGLAALIHAGLGEAVSTHLMAFSGLILMGTAFYLVLSRCHYRQIDFTFRQLISFQRN